MYTLNCSIIPRERKETLGEKQFRSCTFEKTTSCGYIETDKSPL
jgi:hypothetical protein